MTADPFLVPTDEKINKLLGINEAALKAGADYATASFAFVREEKFFASSIGSRIEQIRVPSHARNRSHRYRQGDRKIRHARRGSPRHEAAATIISRATISSARRPRAAEQAKEKLKAKSIVPDNYDLVLDPTNLWLTIHESVGHPTELDRALGWEANFAGTTFCTPDKLGKLKYGQSSHEHRG